MGFKNKYGKEIEILISIDDGDKLDIQMADLLYKYQIPTIFYIAPYHTDLTEHQIRCLAGIGTCNTIRKVAGLFEIGAHTVNHPQDLKLLSDEDAWREIKESKTILETILGGKKVNKFCYPRGRFDERIKKLVKKAGFKEARTTRVMNIEFPKDKFETDTSIHIYPERKEYKGKTWLEVGDELFQKVLKEGGRFEIWGHSYEVEKFNQWEFLDDFLSYMNDEMKKINYPRKK